MPSHYVDRVIMPLKAIEFFVQFPQVIYFDLGVSRPCQEPIAVDRVPPRLSDCIVVSWDSVYAFASCSRIPHLNVAIFASSDNQTLKRMPIAGLDI